jgi:phosphocarrier protein HPr
MNASESVTFTLTVQNKMGIHARPAAMIVRATNRYPETEVWFQKGNDRINGKSIMGLMMLAASQNSKLDVSVQGPHAEALTKELSQLFDQKFDEA